MVILKRYICYILIQNGIVVLFGDHLMCYLFYLFFIAKLLYGHLFFDALID
jgi:hypothetical protein